MAAPLTIGYRCRTAYDAVTTLLLAISVHAQERPIPLGGEVEVDHRTRLARGRVCINGWEGFRSYAKERLMKHHGVSPQRFVFSLKELEFRYNHRHEDLFTTWSPISVIWYQTLTNHQEIFKIYPLLLSRIRDRPN